MDSTARIPASAEEGNRVALSGGQTFERDRRRAAIVNEVLPDQCTAIAAESGELVGVVVVGAVRPRYAHLRIRNGGRGIARDTDTIYGSSSSRTIVLSPEGVRTDVGGGVACPGGVGPSASLHGTAESEQGKEEHPSGCWRFHDWHGSAFHQRTEVNGRGLKATDPDWVSARVPAMMGLRFENIPGTLWFCVSELTVIRDVAFQV